MPVTGFRESAWVAASQKLWQSGADVLLSKDGETFKELKGADFIPVGATLQMDGIRCRIDAVDFAANEVRLTNIEDKNRPIRFSENISYVRSFVEDAGIAIYDAIPKKPAVRKSIREKLKASQKAQPSQPQKVQKLKGKDMEL
jgi:MutS domain I protein